MKTFALQLFAIIWAVLTGLGLLVLVLLFAFFVLTPAAIFLAGYLERRYLRPLTRLAPQPDQKLPRRVRDIVAAAKNQGYRELGLYSGKLGLRRFSATLLLSADDQILALMPHDLSGPQLITRLADDRQILTATDALPDLSGLDDIELVEGGFDAIDARHRQRLEAPAGAPKSSQSEIEAFDPSQVEHRFLEHMRQQVRWLQAAGLARYLDAERTKWTYTLRGAWRLTRQIQRQLTQVGTKRPRSEEEAKVRRFRWWRRLQRFAVLQALWLLPGGKMFEAAYPQWVSALPPWVDVTVVVTFTASVIMFVVGVAVGLHCPICQRAFSDRDGSILLFARIEECDDCGTVIDGPQDSGQENSK